MSTKMDKLVPLFHERIILKKTKINYEDLEHIAAAAVLALVPVVLGFIQELIKRKKEGKAINEEDAEILKDAERSAEEIKEKGTEAGGNWFKDNMVIILGAAAIVLFLLIRTSYMNKVFFEITMYILAIMPIVCLIISFTQLRKYNITMNGKLGKPFLLCMISSLIIISLLGNNFVPNATTS
jgi:hypothetical protein